MDYVSWFRPLFRRRPTFANCLPWDELLDEPTGLMTTVDDGMMSTVALTPKDLASLSDVEQGILSLQTNQAFLRASGVWAYWLHGRRYAVPEAHASVWPDPVSALLDEAYRDSLGVRYDMDHYLTVWHRRVSPTTQLIDQLLFPDDSAPPDAQAQLHHSFTAGFTQLLTHLSSTCHRLKRLDGEALITYLHRFISIYDQVVKVPTTRTNLREYLTDCKLWPGTRLTLGPHKDRRQYIRCLTLTEDLPAESRTLMWPRIYEVDFAFDWMTRVVPIDTQAAATDAEKETINRHALRKSGRVIFYEHVTRHDTGAVLDDEYSLDQMRDAKALRHAMLSQKEAQVHQTTTFLVRGFNPRVVDEQIRHLQSLLQTSGCIVIDEGLNCTEAFFGAIPGQMHTGWRHTKRSGRPNVRELRLTTMNLAHMTATCHKPYTGEQWIPRLNGPALTQAVTDGSTIFGVSPYVGDVGHCKKIGPNGSGKSTELAWEGIQWGRYEGSQLFNLDMGGSSRAMTLCLGGTYRDVWLDGLDIQLFAYLDRPGEAGWVYQWLLNRIDEAGVVKHPDIAKFVWGVVAEMLVHPEWPRSLYDYLNILTIHANKITALARSQGHDRSKLLAQQYPLIDGALRPFARGGPYGHLVDARADHFHRARVQSFDVMALSDVESCYPGVLEALFHRMLGVCHGQPVRTHFDEAHHYFTNPTFVSILKRLFPWMRRNNYSAAFCVQTIQQYTESPLASLLIQNCLVDHYFPDAMANAPEIAPLYEGMGLTATDREIISRATPKEQLYVVKKPEGTREPGGRRLVTVRLPPKPAAVCGSNRQEDHQLMDDLLAKFGEEEFPFRFLDSKGFHDDAHTIRQALARRSLDCPLAPVMHAVAD